MAGKTIALRRLKKYFISGILLFSIIVPFCFAGEFEAKENICQLIETGKFAQAKAATERMAIEYVGQEKLPEMLYWVAERFQRFDRFEDAKGIYQQIIRDFPESSWAAKAKMGNLRSDAMSLIISGKYAEAKEVTDKMAADFAGNTDLPEMLYWIAGRFQQFDRFEDAKQICQQIIQNFPDSPWAKKARIGNSRSEVMSLIVLGKYAEAKEAIDKMASDFAGNPDLAETLYWISGRFQAFDRFEDAKQICEQIIKDYPDSPWAKKAKMGSAMSEAMSLAVSGKYAEAKVVTDKMAADFAGRPDLPEMLYWISERYERAGRAEDAKCDYQRVIDLFPNNPLAKKAKLGIPRAEVIALVQAKDFNNAALALNKMTSDFASHPDLPETLYWMAQRYKDFGRTEDANRIYQQIIQNYPASQYTARAKSVFPTESNVIQSAPVLIIAAMDNNTFAENTENSETLKINVSAEQQNAAVELYHKAREYELQPESGALAKQTYEQIIRQYPGTIKADNVVLDIRRMEIWEKIKASEANETGTLLDKFVADFKKNPYAIECFNQIALKCYQLASNLKKQNQLNRATDYYTLAEVIWQLIIDNMKGNLDSTYYYAALCRQQQNNWYGAICYFRTIVDDYSNSEYAYSAHLGIGENYEALRDSNTVAKEEINPLIEKTYKEILAEHSKEPQISDILLKLGWLTYEQNRYSESIPYFEKALTYSYIKPKEVLCALAEMHENTGDKTNALAAYRQLVSILGEYSPEGQKIKNRIDTIEGNF